MPYAWQMAGDALADLRELEPWLQEEVLDEFDRVSSHTRILRIDVRGFAIHDFERLYDGRSHVVFISLHIDHVRQVASMLGIADHIRAGGQI